MSTKPQPRASLLFGDDDDLVAEAEAVKCDARAVKQEARAADREAAAVAAEARGMSSLQVAHLAAEAKTARADAALHRGYAKNLRAGKAPAKEKDDDDCFRAAMREEVSAGEAFARVLEAKAATAEANGAQDEELASKLASKGAADVLVVAVRERAKRHCNNAKGRNALVKVIRAHARYAATWNATDSLAVSLERRVLCAYRNEASVALGEVIAVGLAGIDDYDSAAAAYQAWFAQLTLDLGNAPDAAARAAVAADAKAPDEYLKEYVAEQEPEGTDADDASTSSAALVSVSDPFGLDVPVVSAYAPRAPAAAPVASAAHHETDSDDDDFWNDDDLAADAAEVAEGARVIKKRKTQ